MMSIKDMINKNIRVTHAIVVVFIWVAVAIMEQFDLYEPIPPENIAFFVAIMIVLLLSKAQDHTNQNLLTIQDDKVEPTSEFDSVMRSIKNLYDSYEKFFKTVEESAKSMSDHTKEEVLKEMRDVDSPEEAEAILKDAIPPPEGDMWA